MNVFRDKVVCVQLTQLQVAGTRVCHVWVTYSTLQSHEPSYCTCDNNTITKHQKPESAAPLQHIKFKVDDLLFVLQIILYLTKKRNES